jgi:hypothetical protein
MNAPLYDNPTSTAHTSKYRKCFERAPFSCAGIVFARSVDSADVVFCFLLLCGFRKKLLHYQLLEGGTKCGNSNQMLRPALRMLTCGVSPCRTSPMCSATAHEVCGQHRQDHSCDEDGGRVQAAFGDCEGRGVPRHLAACCSAFGRCDRYAHSTQGGPQGLD